MVIIVARLDPAMRAVVTAVLGCGVRVVRALDALPPSETLVLDLAGASEDAEACAIATIRARTAAPIVLLAARSTEPLAVAAIQHGVSASLRAPCEATELRAAVGPHLCAAPSSSLIGSSEPARRVRALLEMVGPTDSSVFVSGETGTGKELVARLLHESSPRRRARMVCINCAAIPDSLLESELFGHERGAFTGASSARAGAFELAHGGTLFLDEIGDMSPYAQAKLLRALEDRSVRRVGGSADRGVDIRIIAATNQDLEAQMRAGAFRRDLYFRLNVVRVALPALRERLEDVPLLARRFLDELNGRLGRHVEGFEAAAEAALVRHDWPGNVRELRNVIEGAVVTLRGDRIGVVNLPEELLTRIADAHGSEKERLLATLVETNWNKARAARQLEWSRMTLYRKLEHYRIVEPGRAAPLAKAGATRAVGARAMGRR
jgi:DNA-binding NtrC family response regulator